MHLLICAIKKHEVHSYCFLSALLREVSLSWARCVPEQLAPTWQPSEMWEGCPRNVALASPGQDSGLPSPPVCFSNIDDHTGLAVSEQKLFICSCSSGRAGPHL